MGQFVTKELHKSLSQFSYALLYMVLNSSLCFAGGGTQSTEVDARLTGIGKAAGVVKNLEQKENGYEKVRVDTSEIDTQGQSVGDRKRPFEDVVQSEPSDDTQEPKKIPERWDDD